MPVAMSVNFTTDRKCGGALALDSLLLCCLNAVKRRCFLALWNVISSGVSALSVLK